MAMQREVVPVGRQAGVAAVSVQLTKHQSVPCVHSRRVEPSGRLIRSTVTADSLRSGATSRPHAASPESSGQTLSR